MDGFKFDRVQVEASLLVGRIRIHLSSTTMRCQMLKPDCPYRHSSPILDES